MFGEVRLLKDDEIPNIIYKEGFYALETDHIRPFRWMKNNAKIFVNKYDHVKQWIKFEVGYTNKVPVTLTIDGKKKFEFKILNGWQKIGMPIENLIENEGWVSFQCDYVEDNKNDERNLSLMIGEIKIEEKDEHTYNSSLLAQEVFKFSRVKSKPTFLTYETVARCNLKCAMCAVDESLNKFTNDRKDNTEKTEPIYKELIPYSNKLQLHASGEVLMGNDFWRALNIAGPYSQKHSLEIEIFTNGLLLNAQNRKKILESALTDLVISVDAATKKTYRRIRGGNFTKLCENINNLVQENKKYNNKLRIAMACVLMRENIEELPDFIKLANALGVKTVSFWPLFSTGIDMPIKQRGDFVFYYKQQMLLYYPHLTTKKIDEGYETAEKLNIRVGLTPCFPKDYSGFKHDDIPYPIESREFDKYATRYQETNNYDKKSLSGEYVESYKECYLPWNTAFITTEGRFSPCLLLTYLGGIDSLAGKNFDDAWNSPLMQDLRQHIIEGKIHKLCDKAQCIFVNKKF
ncbi:radical SAM protein [Pectinatus haikarae]|uniref:MoaA/NifB/PqqE/SkfB family radical SAM enzyme n=1 Tax=Pectinatus haikarae TaxID=349096 RepID=A0ABT9Y4C3_9FIRM|nr:radical SAM protein [Pectinatus haikarae]MDQ0202599.1 MoaA/NifB/PqqE/SkfB family radical SAM enzyme [Pectinatus haikarae]